MADARFFPKTHGLSLAQIAEIGDLKLPAGADAARVFTDVAGLETATENDVSWAFIPKARADLSQTKAGAVIVPEKFLPQVPAGCIPLVSADPHRSYGRVAGAFYPRAVVPFISEKAVIHPSATLGEGCRVEAGAVIGERVQIGARTHIQANAVIGDGVEMGEDCLVGATATVSHALLGKAVYIYPGAHVGQDGFGFAMSQKGPQKVPQLGRVIIGDDVEIGAGTTVDRGAMRDTVIGGGTRIDNLVQIGHNVVLGKCCVLVAQVGIAGSCELGDFVVAGGQSGFAGHLKIGTGAQIAAQSGLMSDVEPGAIVMGSPALPHREFLRQVISLKALGKENTATARSFFKVSWAALQAKWRKK